MNISQGIDLHIYIYMYTYTQIHIHKYIYIFMCVYIYYSFFQIQSVVEILKDFHFFINTKACNKEKVS